MAEEAKRDGENSAKPEGLPCVLGRLVDELLAVARQPLAILDGELRLIRANAPFLRAIGARRRDATGRPIFDQEEASFDAPRLRALLERLLPEEGEVRDFELEVAPPREGRRTLLLNARKVAALDGTGDLILLALEDQTAGEERFRLLVDGVKDFAVFMLGPEGQVTSWNAGAQRILGYPKEEILGRDCSLFYLPEDVREGQPADALGAALREGTFETEGWRLKKDGTRFLAHVLVTALGDPEGKLRGFSVVMRDVTERRHLEDQLRQSQKMEAVGRLAGGIAHDFNNLLTAILGYSNLALGRLPEGCDAKRDLEEVKRAGERAAELTRQLLAFSRRQALHPRNLDLNSVVEGSCGILRRVIGEDIEIVRVPGPGLGCVRADPGQIDQVIMNLAVNARDAMPRGGRLTIETANVVLGEDFARTHVGVVLGEYVMLVLSDTGSGMAPEVLSRLFEPFFTTKPPGKGTGLGLSTVYGIVKQSGGTIWVESEPSRGSTFRIYLPRVATVPESQVPHPGFLGGARGHETVLVVEDDEAVRLLAGRILEEQGYRILLVGHPGRAHRILESHGEPIHLLLTDIVMPEMTGFDLGERALSLRPEIKVLYMSGYTSASIVDRLSMGSAFLLKPFVPATLLEKVREVLDMPKAT